MSATLLRKKVTQHGKNVNMSARHETTCRRHELLVHTHTTTHSHFNSFRSSNVAQLSIIYHLSTLVAHCVTLMVSSCHVRLSRCCPIVYCLSPPKLLSFIFASTSCCCCFSYCCCPIVTSPTHSPSKLSWYINCHVESRRLVVVQLSIVYSR